jgi:hypothetical protein
MPVVARGFVVLLLATLGAGCASDRRAGNEWTPAVEEEWRRYGHQEFRPAPADQPHATLVLKDTANRARSAPFEVWVLVDGARVKQGAAGAPLRLSPGAHCIRVEMVSRRQRHEGTVGRYWPWLNAGGRDQIEFKGDGKAGFTTSYRRLVMQLTLDAPSNEQQIKFDRSRPRDPEAAYTYCLQYVRRPRG